MAMRVHFSGALEPRNPLGDALAIAVRRDADLRYTRIAPTERRNGTGDGVGKRRQRGIERSSDTNGSSGATEAA
ncbi:hypothetical protein [Natrinema salaciae]|uniref:Uncharacterized protein n=1 Tax=Natrinema salaciae TaxID=1186196 RepID=A0A1H9GN54_9EURY|nr:hypothetical protein [Natrinema salaciae]SEQ51557.1 hypothetical protein SAMN04489841_1941 [Natrinema salaciae]